MAKKIEIGLLIFFILSGVVLALNWLKTQEVAKARKANSFEECVALGYPVMESYPRQCRLSDGRTFTERVVVPPAAAEVPVKLYWGNTMKDPNVLSCETTYPTNRLVHPEASTTEMIARAAIEALLRGPNNSEKMDGSFTSINSDAKLLSLAIRNGVARADFDNNLQYRVGGSCRVIAITSQIRNTLLQFPEVREAVISILGESEGILQP